MINRRAILVLAACVFPLAAGEIPEKAERYREMLLKRPENAVVFGRMLDAWLEEREFEALAPELKLRAEDGTAADWRVLAMFHQHAGDEEATVAALDEAVKLAPDDATTRLARAKALGAMLRFDAALEDVGLALADPALGVEAGTLKGKLLLRSGRPAEAVEAWQELIAVHPADEGLREDLISLQVGEGMLDEAIAAARELAEATEDPYKKALRQVQVAEILAQAGRKDEALAEYRGVFDVSAENSWLEREVLARVVALFSRDDDPAGLQAFLGDLREAYPRRVAVKKEAAKNLLATGSEDEAVAMFREVLKVLPGDRDVREEFIALLEAAGRMADAAEETEALLAVAPDDAALWERLAFLKDGLEDEAGVDAALDRALALLPDDESGAVARARLVERFGRVDEAEKRLREAVAAHGADGEAGDSLAAFLVAQDKQDEALEIWRGMAAEADREGLLRIARALSAHGQAKEAFAILEPRAAEFPDDPLLLTALCQAAQLGEETEAGIPYGFALVRMAESTMDLESALRLAVALVSRAEEPRKWLDELAAVEEPSVQEICLLAELHESLLGDSIQAEKLLEAAMAEDPDRLAANQRVRLHELRGEFFAAAEAMRELIALPGGAKTAHEKRLVELLERAGDFQAALDRTSEWLKLAPGDKLAWLKRAELFLAEGQPLEAVAELRRAVAKFGGEEDLRARLAEAQRDAGMMDEAWRTFMALHDESDSPTGKLKWVESLAVMARQEGREDELREEFERRSRDNPTSALPLLALAEMHRAWQDTEEELRCVAEASRRKPEDAALKFRLADLHESAGEGDAAAGILRGMLGGGEATEARRRLSAFWIRQGEVERGLRELAAAGAGGDPRTLEKLAMPLARAKDWEAAVSILERERLAHPDDWRLAHFHAVALLEAGREDEAFGMFISLLEAEGDVAGTVPPSIFGGWRPPGVTKKITRDALAMFPQYERTLLLHRQDGHYSGGTPGDVVLPGDADDARRLALAGALHFCGPEVEEELRTARMNRIASSHFDDLEDLKRVKSIESPEALQDALLAEGATPGMFKWFLQHAGNRPGGIDREILERALQLGVEQDPELAFQMGWWLRNHSDGLGEAEARGLMDLLERLEGDEKANGIHILTEIAFGNNELPEALRREAEERYLRHIEESEEGLTKGNGHAISLPARYAHAGRFEEAVQWINRLEDAPEARGGGVQGMQMQHYHAGGMIGRQRGGALEVLDFPTVLRIALPHQYVAFAAAGSGGGGHISEAQIKLLQLLGESGRMPHQEPPIDAEAFAEAAAAIEDPLVRIGIYFQAGRKEEVAREVSAIEAAEDSPAAALLLAAIHRATVSEDNGKAYALLLRAREAPDAKALREVVESQLIRIGAELMAAGGGEVDLEPAKRAALRARRQFAFDNQRKSQLADAMTKLGLEAEAKRYLTGPAFVRSPSRTQRVTSNPGTAIQALTALVRSGDREAAARRILSDLRAAVGDPRRRHQADQLFSMMTNLQIEDEVAAASEPAETATFQRRKFHALLLVRLKRLEDALPWLEALAADKPDDAEVNGAFLAALPPEQRRERLMELAGDDFDTESFGVLIGEMMSRRDTGVLDAGEQMKDVLEALEPAFDGERNLSWVNFHTKQLAETNRIDNKRVRPILGSGSDGEFDEELSDRREALCRDLFRAMLRHPQTAEQGFILLSAAAGPLEISEEELDAAAVQALRRTLVAGGEGEIMRRYGDRSYALWAWMRGNGGSSSGGPPSGGVEPAAYLAGRAKDGVTLALLDDEEFQRELLATHEEQAKMVERCREIVVAEGVEAFEAWKKTATAKPEEAVAELPIISQWIAETGRDDLKPLVTQVACELLRSGERASAAWLASVAVGEVLEAPDREARTAALESLALELLGPEEGWPLYGQLGNGYHQPVYQRMQAWNAAVSAIGGDLPAAVALIRFCSRSGVPAEMMGHSLRNTFQRLANSPPPLAEVVASGLFGFGPEILHESSQTTLMDSVLAILNAYPDKKETAAELAKVEGDDRFWARIAGASLVENPEAVKAELDRQAGAIDAWPAEDKVLLARFVERSFPGVAGKLGPAMRRIFEEGLAEGDEAIRQEALGYLEKGFPQDLSPHNASQTIGPLVRRLLEGEPELAGRLWMAALESVSRQNSGWGSSSGGFATSAESSAHSQMMDRLLQGTADFRILARLHHALEAVEEPAVLPGLPQGNFEYYVQRALSEAVRIRTEAAKADPELEDLPEAARPYAAVFAALTRETEESARPALAALLAVALREFHGVPGTALRESGWIEKKLAPLDARVARSVRIDVRAREAGNLDDAGKTALAEDCAAFFGDEEIPLTLRIAALGKLRELAPLRSHAGSAEAAARLWQRFLARPRQWATSETTATLLSVADWPAVPPEQAKGLLVALDASRLDLSPHGGSQQAEERISSIRMSLAMRSGDGDLIRKSVRDGAVTMRGRLDLALELWRGGFAEEANRLLARPGDFNTGLASLFQGKASGFSEFSKELETALPEWLATISDPGQRFRVECLVAALPDAEGDAAPEVARPERIAALTGRFAAEGPNPRAARMETLAALASEPEAAAPLVDEAVDLTRNSDLATLVATRRQSHGGGIAEENVVLERLIHQTMRVMLEARGDAAALLAQVDGLQILSGSNDHRWEANQAIEGFIGPMTALLVRRIVELEDEPRAALAAQALELCTSLLGFPDEGRRGTVVALAIASQAAAGDGAALDRWLEALPPELKSRYEQQRENSNLQQTFGALRHPELQGERFAESRRALLVAMIADPATLARDLRHPTDVSLLVDSGLFDLDDACAAIDALPDDHPQRPQFLTEKAGMIGWRTDRVDDTIAAYDAARAAAEATGDPKALAYARSYWAAWLNQRQNKRDEAVEIARSLDFDDLGEKERNWMTDLLKSAE